MPNATRVAIVRGGSRGTGREFVTRLAADGYAVVDRTHPPQGGLARLVPAGQVLAVSLIRRHSHR